MVFGVIKEGKSEINPQKTLLDSHCASYWHDFPIFKAYQGETYLHGDGRAEGAITVVFESGSIAGRRPTDVKLDN